MMIEDLPSPKDYQLLAEIYRSVSSFVYRGKRLQDGRNVIVKLLKHCDRDGDFSSFSDGLIAYAHQYAIAKSLNSIHVVRPCSLEKYGSSLILVLPDDGCLALREYISSRCLNAKDVLDLGLLILDAIADLHQNKIVHQQINPNHLLIHPETKQVKIIDFSLAEEIVTAPQDFTCDLFNLGVILYELLTKKTFVSSQDCQHNLEGGEELEKIILKLVADREHYPYRDAIAARADLRRSKLVIPENSTAKDLVEDLRNKEQISILPDFFKLVIDSIPQAIFWKDRNSIYLGCNQKFAKDAGVKPEEIVGKSDLELPWTKEEADWYRECDERVMDNDSAEYHIVETQLQADGNLCWVDTNKIPLHDTTGKVIGILGTCEDISQQKKIAIEIHQKEEKFRTLVSNVHGAVYRCLNDVDWTMEFISDAIEEVSGYPATDFINSRVRTYVSIIHPQDIRQVEIRVTEALERQESFVMEYRILHRQNNEIRWVYEKGKGIFDRDDKLLHIEGVIFDISEQKSTAVALANQLKRSKLLTRITQEIRQTLDTQQIFKTATREIRQYLNTDRVGIFHFNNLNGNLGEFIAEDILPTCSSLLVGKIQDSCFNEQIALEYSRGKVLAINDVELAKYTDCHRELLSQFQVRANLIIPLLQGEDLWGLLCIHQCDLPRNWQESEIQFVQKIAIQLNLALQQARLLEEAKKQKQEQYLATRQEQLLNRAIKRIHQNLGLDTLYQAIDNVLLEIKQFFNCEYLDIYQFESNDLGEFNFESVSSGLSKLNASERSQDNSQNFQTRLEIKCDRLQCLEQQECTTVISHSCNQEVIEQLGQQTDLAIPIFIDSQLWGVIVALDRSRQKQWKLREINFFEQISDRLEIALQQAKLLEQLRQAKTKADSANKAKSKFLASMSHELRTPLNAILGFSQLMQKDISLNSQQRDTLNIINTSGEHLLKLINDILEMSKIEADKIYLNCHDFDLHRLLDSVNKMLVFKAKSKGLELKFNWVSTVPRYINTDENKLRQVLINLLSNSIKFTTTGSVILDINAGELQANNLDLEAKQLIKFKVIDTGVGIESKDLPLLFKPFYQSDAGFRAEQGTGLGLSISSKFIQLMGGDIKIASELGKGTTVEFDILVNSANLVENPTETTDYIVGIAPDSPTYRILIVEDKWESRELLVQLLDSIGFIVRAVADGQQAVELWQEWQPELILMDIQMPVMNGYQAISKIRQEETQTNNNAIIIALTASVFQEEKKQILAVGANDVINKPFKELVLLHKIQSYLNVDFIYQKLTYYEENKFLPEKNLSDLEISNILKTISFDWIFQLHWSAIKLDEEKMFELIAEAETELQDFADILRRWINEFKFDSIVKHTQKIVDR